MFHPHFFELFFGKPHNMADTMKLIFAFKVEQDLQDKWREEREQENRAEVGRKTEERKG